MTRSKTPSAEMVKHLNLVEDVRKSLTDIPFGVSKCFSIDLCREFYKKHVDNWDKWITSLIENPAATYEEETFGFKTLEEIMEASKEATNIEANLKNMDYVDWVSHVINNNEIIVSWIRLKTFAEWFEQWVADAVKDSVKNPYRNANAILCEGLGVSFTKLGRWVIDLYACWLLSDEQVLKEINWDPNKKEYTEKEIGQMIEEARHTILDIEENNKPKKRWRKPKVIPFPKLKTKEVKVVSGTITHRGKKKRLK